MNWKPDKEWIENSNVYKFMIERNLTNLEEFIKYSYSRPESFWREFLDTINLKFQKPYSKVLDLSRGKPWPKWFIDGRLNIAANIPETSEIFIKWMDETGNAKKVSYYEIAAQAKSIASFLKKIGLKKGDRVAVYMPMIPELIAVMLGIIRAGLIFVPLFSGFGSEPIRTRIEDSEAKLIFTVDTTLRKGKEIRMLDNLSEIKISKVVLSRSGYRGDYDYKEDVLKTGGDYIEETSTEDPLMIIYTSGTTGKPKGCVHVHGGFPIKAIADIYFHFDLKPKETLMWVTDMGWMMGPWMVMGGLLLNSSIGMIEGYVSLSTLTKFVEDMKVDILGLSATLVRNYKRESNQIPKLHVRIGGNTGEPIDVDSWNWLYNAIGKNPIINYSGGTEISGGILGNYVIKEIKPSSFNGASPGMEVSIFDEDGKLAKPFTEGELVVLSVWPGITRGFWRDEERYLRTYWSRWEGVWVHGDLAYYDNEGYIYIVGRSDDVIKVAGKRIGPAEIEDSINSYPLIVESACVGIPHEIKGEVIYCFAVSKGEVKKEDLITYLERKLGKAYMPEDIIFVRELPKTRNAKIMRRLIRAIILNKPVGDTSALENPQSLDEIKEVWNKYKLRQ
ncbi:MAG: AMP-binding protein [Sulfolobaceae archaeon]